MHSAEPLDSSVPNSIPPISSPTSENDEWRAEVASRVHSYRARQKNRVAEQQSLGFPAQSANSAGEPGAKALATESEPAHSEGAEIPRGRVSGRKPNESLPGAFDTNYYRRLNALEQSAQTAAAMDIADLEDSAEQELQFAPRSECNAIRDLAVGVPSEPAFGLLGH